MLTRLKVNGFKNLVDVDVRFGPFTCIAGANGVGKSNLFDAIRFLSALSDTTLLDAASYVRAEGEKVPDVKGLFNKIGSHDGKTMNFEAEMIVPQTAVDDLGKEGKAKITILQYRIELTYREPELNKMTYPGVELVIKNESLVYIQKGEARKHIRFRRSNEWLTSTVIGASRTPFISTILNEENMVLIKLHQDGNKGRPSQHIAESLPRTILSSGNASESPTVLCARREMASWRLLQLEPSSLRKSSDFNSPTNVSVDGKYLSGTLYRMARNAHEDGVAPDEESVYCQVANRLSELIGHVDSIWIDLDEKRELFTLMLKETNGTVLPAKALSDGTLRFLALAVIEMDSSSGGVICLEEPENGIHPERIPAMLRLLQDVATDTNESISPGNPLRQVILNTHSPTVVGEVPDESLLVAESVETVVENIRGLKARFSCLPNTWRANSPEKPHAVAKGNLMAYLNPSAISPERNKIKDFSKQLLKNRSRRVRDREDLQLLLPLDCS